MTSLTYAANTLMAYVGPDADVVGVSGTVCLPDWEATKVFFFQTNEFGSPGIRQFGIDSGDETLQKSMATIGTAHLYAGPTGGAATLSYDGDSIFFVSDPWNTSQVCKVRASDLVLQSTLGYGAVNITPDPTDGAVGQQGVIAPYFMAGVLMSSASRLVTATGLNLGDVHDDAYVINADTFSSLTSTWLDETDEHGEGGGMVSRHGVSTGLSYQLGIPFANDSTGSSAATGLYSLSATARVKIGTFLPTDVDATWTKITSWRGVAYDETDGHVIIGVATTDAVSNTKYIVKLNSATAAVMWTRAVNSLTAYSQSFINARIRNSRFHYIGSAALVYHINTATGALASSETFTGLGTPTGPQMSDDVSNSVIFYGSFTAAGSPPTYVGAVMDVGGQHVLSQTWMRAWFATAPGSPTPPGDIGGQALSESRAWTYTLDGHTFYVLDLLAEGTFVCDLSTGNQWAKFLTDGYSRWNMQRGTMWGPENAPRIVAGAIDSEDVWELVISALTDQDGDLNISHLFTGGIQTRSRTKHGVSHVRLTGSVGQLGDSGGATMRLRFSDNNGRTWSDYFDLALTQGDYSGEMAWRALGSFAAPGRIFEFSDTGGPIRIDGCDAEIDGMDEDNAPTG